MARRAFWSEHQADSASTLRAPFEPDEQPALVADEVTWLVTSLRDA